MHRFRPVAAPALLAALVAGAALPGAAATPAEVASPMLSAVPRLTGELVAAHGETQRARAERGLMQIARVWRVEDGDEAAFAEFARRNFAGDEPTRKALRERMDRLHEQLDGSLNEITLAFRWQTDVEAGPILAVDELTAAYDPGAHIDDDFFTNKIAFVVLLNFPLATLDEKLRDGPGWSAEQWAEARLADRYSSRIPAAVNQRISTALADAESYIAGYNIWMHHLLDADGKRQFPAGKRLITHWNLRDELKAQYAEKDGLPRQRMIALVLERIVDQTIPAVVIDNPHVDWEPESNRVSAAAVQDSDRPAPAGMKIVPDREPDTRYAKLLETYRAARLADPYTPAAPSLIARRFNEDRELPEARVKAMLEEIVGSPLVPRVSKLIEARLKRPLEPFDIWYNGFLPRGKYTEAELDAITKKKYPTPEGFSADIPAILVKLGFSEERARYVAANIAVDPSRGAGHAWGAQRRGDKAHLRTRVGADGMDYKGYNIAVHELGHNVEQTFSLNQVPYNALEGVPNTAFTEALAFVFQARDLELLGLAKPDAQSEALTVLDDFWGAYEIGGVALTDMRVWRWMYAHPDATPAELRQATLGIAREVWNRFYAPVFGRRDVVLLGVYSHMINSMLYLPDYPVGAMIARQVEQQIARSGNLGAEFERMTSLGRLTPDLWMQKATGAPVGPAALLEATSRALTQVRSGP
jgi:hypothetical protein